MTVIRTISCSLLAVLCASCCNSPHQQAENLNYPGTLQPPCSLRTEAVWQQRVTAKWQQPGQDSEARGFDAAVQRSGDALTVIGLSPMGSVGFSIQQRPTGIDVVNNMPEQLLIPPRFILLDVQRTFFPWIHDEQQMASGERVTENTDEEIRETWLDGRLQQRTFRRLDAEPKGLITIRYEWQQPEWAVPTLAMLDNAWFGYQLTIVTHSETRLDSANPEAQR